MISKALALAAIFKTHGLPSKCLKFARVPIVRESETHSVFLRMLAAPINPSDINAIEGVYPVSAPKITDFSGETVSVGGFEGSAEVLDVCQKSVPVFDAFDQKINPGDMVVPFSSGFGTWRSHVFAAPKSLINLSALGPKISFRDAAMVTINPCTAYRFLSSDFVKLSEGDVIMQNAASSSVGKCVIQLARERGIKTINVIRDKQDFEDTASMLKSLGADIVLKESEILSFLKKCEVKPKLGLNCVGGQSGSDIARSLSNGGVMVTYGGLSKQPMTVSTTTLLFKDIQLRGFWLTRWRQQNKASQDEHTMFSDIVNSFALGKLKSTKTQEIKVPITMAQADPDGAIEMANQNLETCLSNPDMKSLFVFE